jgi:hypothetical protein
MLNQLIDMIDIHFNSHYSEGERERTRCIQNYQNTLKTRPHAPVPTPALLRPARSPLPAHPVHDRASSGGPELVKKYMGNLIGLGLDLGLERA